MGLRGCVPRWLLGAVRGFSGASVLIVHQYSKITHLRLFGAIAFPRSFNKSVLRGFLGGLFGFIGFRCIFGCLVAFVALVGLYACNVRRLRTEKRKTCKFIGFIGFLGFIGLLRSCGCFVWFVLLLLRSCSLLGVVVLLAVLFPFGRYDNKERAHRVGASSLCSLVVSCSILLR